MIEKIKCRNHLLRNFCQKLTNVAKLTQYPINLRKHILFNILRFQSDVTKAVKYQKNNADFTKV